MSKGLRQELSIILIVKVSALGLIWWMLFSSSPPVDVAQHLINPATTQSGNGQHGE